MKKFIYTILSIFLCMAVANAQSDKKEVRSGNRYFRKNNYKEADIAYRKALVKDSLSVAANYNLANTLYRSENYDEAGKTIDKARDIAVATPNGADYFFNAGDIALARKDYGAAVEAFMKSLLLDPQDLEAKENYIYARKMLKDQQQNGGGQDNQDQNNQNQDNQDQGNDQSDNGQDDQNDSSQDNGRDQKNGQDREQEVKISPQQAQQMLKAIQAKEKETQEKVNKEKAASLKSRQKEKNW